MRGSKETVVGILSNFLKNLSAKDLLFLVVGLFSFYDTKKEKNGFKVTMCYEELGSAYVRTSSYIDWIQKHVGRGNYCE